MTTEERKQRVEQTIDELFKEVCTPDITLEQRDDFRTKERLLLSLLETD